jgi:uroporphyrinogen decarboxylase
MNSRETILAALNHQESSKIPVDFGGSSTSGIHVLAYLNLLEYLNMQHLEVKLFDPMMQLAMVHDEVRDYFNIDTEKLYRPTPKFGIAIYKGWKKYQEGNGVSYLVPADYSPIDSGDYLEIREKGVLIAKKPKKALYYDNYFHPYSDHENHSDLDKEKFSIYSQGEVDFISESLEKIHRETSRAIIFSIKGSFLETPCDLRGYNKFFMDLAMNKRYTEKLLDILLKNYIDRFEKISEIMKGKVDVIKLTDDFGANNSMLISPKTYREIIKPRQKILFETIKKNSNFKILLHSCGSIKEIIPDLIEIGVDAINPIQANAYEMNPESLKKDFGKDITFWGGTITPQELMENDYADITSMLLARIEKLNQGGGFVYSFTHNFQPDIDPEKIELFFKIPEIFSKRG